MASLIVTATYDDEGALSLKVDHGDLSMEQTIEAANYIIACLEASGRLLSPQVDTKAKPDLRLIKA